MCTCSGCVYKNQKYCKVRDCTCLRKYKTCTEQFGICKQVTTNGAERRGLHILSQGKYCLRVNTYCNIFLYTICFYRVTQKNEKF